MKIFELFSERFYKSKIDYNLPDDLICFMHNDPEFYRKEYYPVHRKFVKVLDADREVSPKALRPLVQKAFTHYKIKFPVEGLEENLNDDDLEEICEKLISFETENYHKEKDNKED